MSTSVSFSQKDVLLERYKSLGLKVTSFDTRLTNYQESSLITLNEIVSVHFPSIELQYNWEKGIMYIWRVKRSNQNELRVPFVKVSLSELYMFVSSFSVWIDLSTKLQKDFSVAVFTEVSFKQ